MVVTQQPSPLVQKPSEVQPKVVAVSADKRTERTQLLPRQIAKMPSERVTLNLAMPTMFRV